MKNNNYLIEAALFYIRDNLKINLWNKHQKEIDPFGNYGDDYIGKVFEVKSYDWSSEGKSIDDIFNFKWRDFKVCWYKYLGRGMEYNRKISNDEINLMLNECINEINKKLLGLA